MLDAGTGTGLLSLMVAQKTDALIDAVELDASAAEQAKENSTASPWRERICVHHSNVLQWRPPSRYDIVLSNPPFYEGDLKAPAKEKNLAHHDEGLTLSALFEYARQHLTNEGAAFFLLPAKREATATKLLTAHGFWCQRKTYVQQTPNHSPFRLMIQATRMPVAMEEDYLVIKSGPDYTPATKALLKDYYLHL